MTTTDLKLTITPARIDSEKLTWDRDTKTFQGKWSELGLDRLPTVITTTYKSRVLDFGFFCTDRDPFGEVCSWVYLRVSRRGEVELRIWND